jgi:hypothetical protein
MGGKELVGSGIWVLDRFFRVYRDVRDGMGHVRAVTT